MRRLNLRGRAPNELAAGESAVAADAKRVRNAGADAKLDADQSGAAACESPISGVAQTSNAIGQIIDIADKIASQANGSAFESSVEKACVREARRRVAIVAAEMRSRSALGAGSASAPPCSRSAGRSVWRSCCKCRSMKRCRRRSTLRFES